MLDAFRDLLCSKLYWHIYNRPGPIWVTLLIAPFSLGKQIGDCESPCTRLVFQFALANMDLAASSDMWR